MKRRISGVLVVTVMLALATPARVSAQTSDGASSTDPSLSARDDYEAVLDDELAARDDYDAAVKRAEDAAHRIEELESEIAEVRQEQTSAEVTLAATEQRLGATVADLEGAEARLASEQQRLRAEAVAAYMGGGTPIPSLGNALADPAALDNYARSQVYADAVVSDRKIVIRRVEEARADAERLRGEADAARGQAQSARDELAARQDELIASQAEQRDAQAAADAAAADREARRRDLDAKRREVELRYAAEILQSDTIGATLAARQKGQTAPEDTLGMFLNPIRNGRIVSEYGPRIDPFLGTVKVHAGLDIDGTMGEPERASADGEVVIASEQGGYGNAVVIDHGNTLATLYGHMSSIAVKPGDIVRRGDVIGLVGSTGRSTGPHCHWEVRINGMRVAPRPYLDMTPEP